MAKVATKASRLGRKVKALEGKLAQALETGADEVKRADFAERMSFERARLIEHAVGLLRSAADQFEARGAPATAQLYRVEADKLVPRAVSADARREAPSTELADVLGTARARTARR